MAKIETNQGWKYVGGRLCLDFVNTVGGRAGDETTVLREKLVDFAALLDWACCGGAVNLKQARLLAAQAARHPKQAGVILARAVALREALYRIFKSSLEGRRPMEPDLDALTREIRAAQEHRRLTRSTGGFEWRWDNPGSELDRLLWPVSLSAADVLASADLAKLRQCTGHDCGWLFLDTSRNGSRRWCDMQDCGNRAKVRRFRQRLQAQQGRQA